MRTLGILSALAVAGTVGLASGEAKAAPLQYVAILLDGSGSMLEDAYVQSDPGMPQVIKSKWREGLDRAMQRVAGQKIDKDQRMPTDPQWYVNEDDDLTKPPPADNYYPAATHCYRIWILADTAVTPVAIGSSTGWVCAGTASAKNPQVYEDVRSTLNSLSAPANLGISTPLADGLCEVLDRTNEVAGAGEWTRSIILESDGLENSSTLSLCKGTTAGTFDPAAKHASNNSFFKWAGGVPKESWMYKVYNKSIGAFNSVDFYPDPAASPPWPNTSILGIRVSPESQSSLAYFYGEAYNLGSPQAGLSVSRIAVLNVDALYNFIPPGTTAATAAAMQAATISDPLRLFFKGVGQHTRGRYQKIQFNASTPSKLPGEAKLVKGDANNTGCTTIVDYNTIRQSDVFGRPSNATPHTKQCDINRDGWVTQADATIVLQNLNKCKPGCTPATCG
jgi:hypothetical protein